MGTFSPPCFSYLALPSSTAEFSNSSAYPDQGSRIESKGASGNVLPLHEVFYRRSAPQFVRHLERAGLSLYSWKASQHAKSWNPTGASRLL